MPMYNRPPLRRRRVIRRRRPMMRRRTNYRRRTMIPRTVAYRRTPDIHAFKRTTYVTINNAAGTDPFIPVFAYNFSLSQLSNPTEFTNLFDQYKITTAVMRWSLDLDPGAQSATNAQIPELWISNEFTNFNNWANLDAANETQRKRQYLLRPGYKVKHVVKPPIYVTGGLFAGDTTPDYTFPKWNQWLPTTLTTIQHGYVRYLFKNLPSVYTIRLEIDYYIKCRHAQ